jgi:hypothetical protein
MASLALKVPTRPPGASPMTGLAWLLLALALALLVGSV